LAGHLGMQAQRPDLSPIDGVLDHGSVKANSDTKS
jgi:hypothetical protein